MISHSLPLLDATTKTFQIGSITFQLLVAKLFRSAPFLSSSQYQNFPSHISRYQNFSYRFQYFPTPSTKTFRQIGWFHYFPTQSTKTFQVIYHATKTFLIGSITFHLTVPKLSNSHCQNFPNFLLFCMRKIVLQN